MNRLLNNRVGKGPKVKKRGCLFLIAGSLLALLATVAFIFGVSLLTGVVIESRHGGEVAYALMTAAKPCYGVAMLLFYAMLAVWYVSPTESELRAQKKKITPGVVKQETGGALSRRTLWLITGGLALGVLLTGALCVSTYRLVTPDGTRTYCFFETSRYEWRQVSSYKVDCDTDGGLSMTFTMRDGKQAEILQGINSATAEFKEKYTSVTHFSADIDSTMQELQIPRNTRHYERAVTFYQDSYPELWPYVAQIIGYEDLEELPDETVAETVTETTTEAD